MKNYLSRNKDEYLINKKLFDKCQKLLKDQKLININHNFINEPICLTDEHEIILRYGGTAVKTNVNNNDVNNLKNLLMNYILIIY